MHVHACTIKTSCWKLFTSIDLTPEANVNSFCCRHPFAMPPLFSTSYLNTWDIKNHLKDDADPSMSQSFIGIIVAIAGNILISLALNCQKLAHYRLDGQHSASHEGKSTATNEDGLNGSSTSNVLPANEAAPLLSESVQGNSVSYAGTQSASNGSELMDFKVKATPLPPKLTSRLSSTSSHRSRGTPAEERLVPIGTAEVVNTTSQTLNSPQEYTEDARELENGDEEENDPREEGDYLKSKLWYGLYTLVTLIAQRAQYQVVWLCSNERWRNWKLLELWIRSGLRRGPIGCGESSFIVYLK